MGIRSKVRAWLHDDKAIRALHKRVYAMGVEQCGLRDHVSRLVNENQDLKLKVQHLEADLKAAHGSVSALDFMYKDLEGQVIKHTEQIRELQACSGQQRSDIDKLQPKVTDLDSRAELALNVSRTANRLTGECLDKLRDHTQRLDLLDGHTEELDHKVGGFKDAAKSVLNRLKLLEIGRAFRRPGP